MRVSPNHHRLRVIALCCWISASLWILSLTLVTTNGVSLLLAICVVLFSAFLLALGISFWLLGRDRRAGVVFDSKGLLLNLGRSTSFVSWDNIERIGVSNRRSTWMALGSIQQLGIRLYRPEPYIQSCEVRLPAADGPLAGGVYSLSHLLSTDRSAERLPTIDALNHVRVRTGYDILVPEAFLGGKAESFVHLIHAFRANLR